MISLENDTFIRNPSWRQVFERTNANEFSNIIFAHHLRDKTKLLHQNKITHSFCRTKPKPDIEIWTNVHEPSSLILITAAAKRPNVQSPSTDFWRHFLPSHKHRWGGNLGYYWKSCRLAMWCHPWCSLLSACKTHLLDHRLAAFRTDALKVLREVKQIL